MKFIVATVLLASCLTAQAITIWDYCIQNTHGRNTTGTPSKSGQFPYEAAIWKNWPKGFKTFYGGALISSRWVLTAAHCVQNAVSLDIKLGGLHMNQFEPGQVELTSNKTIMHPDFDNPFLNIDMALIELPEAVSFTDKIQPLRLPSRSEAGDRLENIRVILNGWETMNDMGPWVCYMAYDELDTITNAECQEVYGEYSVTDSNLCCKEYLNYGPCNGDYGGPLVRTAEDGQLTHIGILSFVHKEGCASGKPSVYIRTASYLDWISEHTGIPIRP